MFTPGLPGIPIGKVLRIPGNMAFANFPREFPGFFLKFKFTLLAYLSGMSSLYGEFCGFRTGMPDGPGSRIQLIFISSPSPVIWVRIFSFCFLSRCFSSCTGRQFAVALYYATIIYEGPTNLNGNSFYRRRRTDGSIGHVVTLQKRYKSVTDSLQLAKIRRFGLRRRQILFAGQVPPRSAGKTHNAPQTLICI